MFSHNLDTVYWISKLENENLLLLHHHHHTYFSFIQPFKIVLSQYVIKEIFSA